MQIRRGIGVCPGVAIGPAAVIRREACLIARRHIAPDQVKDEQERFHRIHEAGVRELRAQVEELSRKIGPVASRILESHSVLLADETIRDEIVQSIGRHKCSAEFAVRRAFENRRNALEQAGGAFARRVIQDLREIEDRLMRSLSGPTEPAPAPTSPVVWVAHDLSPPEVAALDRSNTLGLLLATGGRSSHSAIVAHTMGIPTVVGVEDISVDVGEGDTVVLDGAAGMVILAPDEGTLKRYQAMQRNLQMSVERLERDLRTTPAITRDGHRIQLLANVEFPEEIDVALEKGAEGIGLYRTEFLFLSSPEPPDENAHFESYRASIQRLGARPIVIRTLDLGADKVPLQGGRLEPSSFMGTRAIRLCLERRDLFEPQLRAILRAAKLGNVSIMFPMITNLPEILEVKRYMAAIQGDLSRNGEAFQSAIPTGVMIETPGAAIIADLIAPHVDFFSIGTNDLISFTIAVDRGNEHVSPLFSPAHPAVLRMVKSVIEAGAHARKPVALCGEMSSDITYTILLLGLGLRNFSVVPTAIPEIKKIIRTVSLAEAQQVATTAMSHDTAEKSEEYLREETAKILPEIV